MGTDKDKDQPEKPRRVGFVFRALGIFGIERRRNEGQWVMLTRRFPFVVFGAGVVLLVTFASILYYTSTSGFCNSCHYMKPFVATWKESTHSTVQCTMCHFPPGLKNFVHGKVAAISQLVQTFTGTEGPMPYAEVEDAACLRDGCHETRLLKGKVLFKGKYNFDHVPHLTKLRRGITLRCTSCHSQIVQGQHISVTESTCFICHFKGNVHERVLEPIAGCTLCHEPPSEPLELAQGETFEHAPFVQRGVACWKCHFDSVEGTGDVPRQVCKNCHNVPERLAKYSDPDFLHDWHVTQRKVECFSCHTEIQHGLKPEAYETRVGCTTCHSARHGIQADMYVGRGGKGVEGKPSKHSLVQVDCMACHATLATSEKQTPGHGMSTYVATEEACLECHGDGVEGMLQMWKTALEESLAETKVKIDEAQKAYASLAADSPNRAEAGALLAKAVRDYEFVKKAHGEHNPEYAFDLLDVAASAAAKAARLAEQPGTTKMDLEEE